MPVIRDRTTDEIIAENDRLRAALDAADYYIGRLERCRAGKTVTDLGEAESGYSTRRKLILSETI